jgi:hypothetical protein
MIMCSVPHKRPGNSRGRCWSWPGRPRVKTSTARHPYRRAMLAPEILPSVSVDQLENQAWRLRCVAQPRGTRVFKHDAIGRLPIQCGKRLEQGQSTATAETVAASAPCSRLPSSRSHLP